MGQLNLGRVRIVPKGEWGAATAYELLDCVSYVGASYLAIRDVPAGTALTDATYWQAIAEPGVYAFALRSDAVAACADGWRAENGAIYWIGGKQYRGETDAVVLADLPGLVPHGPVVSSDQWGLNKTGTDQTDLLRDMFEWCAENAQPLEIEPGIYGFTNFGVVVSGGHFDVSAPRGEAIFRQLAGRDGDAMAIQFGGQNIATVALDASAAAGDTSLTLTDAGNVQPGDTLRLRLSRVLEGDHRFDPDRSYIQLCKVLSKSGDTVRIVDPLVFDFPVGVIATGTAQAGSAGTITLAAGSAFDEPAVKGYKLRITAGTGAGQERFIDTYDPATKVVGIGTASSFTGVNQAAFSPAPDATSVYQIVAEVDIDVDRPATGKIRDLIFEGYSPSGEITKGLHLARWDGALFDGLRIADFSSHGVYTTRCYKSTVQRCRFERANYAEAGGAGLGYGHNDQAGFMNTVTGCHAVGCRTGFDNGTTTLFLTRHGNTVTGGGLTYDGQPFWPAVGGVENSGFSTHGGNYGGTDRDNATYDVRSCKIRATQYRAQGNRHFGQMGDDGVYRVYYSGSVEIVDCEYSDLFSTMPTARSNSTLNEGGKNTPAYPAVYQRPRAFVVVRHQTMAKNSHLTIARNTARSVLQSMVFLDEETTAENLALHVIGNRFSVVSEGANVLSVVKATTGLGAGTIGLRQFWAWGNDFSVGGTAIGAVLTDNHNPYPILSSLVSLTDVRLTADAVGHYRALTRAQLVGMASGPWQVGAVVTADGRDYRFTGTTPEIPDLPGWVPHREITPEHFGAVDGTADETQINLAIAYADAIGGGEVWCRGQYTVAPSGTWSTSNGDLNVAVRLATTNPVILRGVPGVSRFTLTGTKIAHVVGFGQRVGGVISSKGGIDGIEVVGNRTTAVSEGVPFEGGTGIYFVGPGNGVRIRNVRVADTWGYGISAGRAYFENCLIENFLVEDTGNDGIDCKFDYPGDYSSDSPSALEAGNGNNWVRNGIVRRVALRWESLTGQKAGVDLRVGWNAENLTIETTVPAVGFRTQHDDEAVTTPELGAGAPSTDNDKIKWQGKYSCIEVFASGTLTGLDGGSTSIDAKCFQFSTYRPVANNLLATGAVQNFWIRSFGGSFTNLVGRAATAINLAVYGNTDGSGSENRFFGGEMVGATTNDIRVYGASGGEPSDTSFFGIKAGTVTINASVARTGFYDCEITTMTDSGTDTLRIKAGLPSAFKAGRNATQYVEFTGDGAANYIKAYGSAKPLRIENEAGADIVYNVPTGESHFFRVNNSDVAQFDGTGLRLTTGAAVFNAGLQVLAARRTGWAAATGTATRTTFATGTVTTAQLAERVKALIDDLIAHGAIGA